MSKNLFLAAAAGSLIALTACDDKACDTGSCDSGTFVPSGDDTGGSSAYAGATMLDAVSWNCDAVGYFFDIGYLGWSASADLWFAQTTNSAWTEIHTVVPASEDANGYDSYYYFELDSVYSQGIGSVNEGTTTYFDCSVHAGTEIFQFDLYDENNAYSDCALFGANTSGTVGGDGSGGYYGSGWAGDCANVW